MNNALSNLAWGTPKQNSADRVCHKTDLRGASVYNAKLTDSAALEVFRADGRHVDIARVYGIDRSLVGKIKTGKAWCHVTKSLVGEQSHV